MEHLDPISREDTLATDCAQSAPSVTRKVAQAGQHAAPRSERESSLLTLGVRVLRSAVERGDTHVAGWLLERNPEFIGLVRIAEDEATKIVEEARIWLRNARAFEERNGPGSMLKPEHPVNLQFAAAARSQAERAKRRQQPFSFDNPTQ